MIDYLLIICATLVLCYSIEFYLRLKHTNVIALSRYVLLLGIGGAFWEYGYAFVRLFGTSAFAGCFLVMAFVGIGMFLLADTLICMKFSSVQESKNMVSGEKNSVLRRELQFATLLSILSFALAVAIPLFDLGMSPLPALGCFVSFFLFVYVLKDLKNYNISGENLSKYIYENGKIGFLSFQMNGRLISLNPVAAQIVGIHAPDGQRLSDVFDLNGANDAGFLEEMKASQDKTYHLVAKNTDALCFISFREIQDRASEPHYLICAIYDRSKEEEILESIRKSGKAKNYFLASMSHEIRTPINAILGMCEMIERECGDKQVLGYSRSMNKAGQQLLSIVNDVLDYSKIQSGMMELLPARYDLAELIHQLVISYEPEIKGKGIAFSYEVEKTLPTYLYGDKVRILQILKNLLSNAVKYTEEGTITFRVYGEQMTEEQVILVFEVQDTGKGISGEEQEAIFDAFRRADHDRNQTIVGTGIGLPIANNLANMMGGSITLSSEPGNGSCFKVLIPQKVVSYHQIGDYEQALSRYKAEYTSRKNPEYTAPAASILVVDDNSINLSIAQFLLEKTEAKVDTASSGKEALQKIREKSYQLIFLDHIMMDMDGIETLKVIREEHLADEVPVIALTANEGSGAKEMYLDYGFQDYLSKPIGKGTLEKKVHDWLPKSYIHYQDAAENGSEENGHGKITVRRLPSDFSGNDMGNAYILENNGKDNQLLHVFVINPMVASDQKVKEIRDILSKTKDIRYFIFTSDGQGAETELTRKIQQYFSGQRIRIYCVGGSGTLRNVVNGIEDFERVEVAFLSLGLTNDFVKTLGGREEQYMTLKNLLRGEVKKIDYIETTGGIALNTFSLGLDANVVCALEKNRIFKMFGKMVPYINAFLYAWFASTPDEYEITVDGVPVYTGLSSEVIFGNGNVLGGMFTFGRKQKITDGKGCVLIEKKRQGFDMLPSVRAMLKGDLDTLEKKNLVMEAADFSIRRRDGGQLAMNFDGEMVYGIEQWDARIVKQGLKFVIPKGVTIDE